MLNPNLILLFFLQAFESVYVPQDLNIYLQLDSFDSASEHGEHSPSTAPASCTSNTLISIPEPNPKPNLVSGSTVAVSSSSAAAAADAVEEHPGFQV